MPKHVLLIHGNGGANARFQLMLDIARENRPADLKIHLPLLPGFEGRPLPFTPNQWDPFIKALVDVIKEAPNAEWVLYGHGIGGSFLLEWAARNWALSAEEHFQPRLVILHSIVGASLQARWFPKLMYWRPMRSFIHWMIYQPMLQKSWEKRLFLNPNQIPKEVKDRFFEDYKQCAAFPVLFDIITPNWYKLVQQKIKEKPFYFLWGAKERVVAANYLDYWKRDFLNSRFELIPEWDHFPMLDDPSDFYFKLKEIIDSDE